MTEPYDISLDRRILARLQPTGSGWLTFGLTLVAVVVALLLSSVLIAATGGSPIDSGHALWTGSAATRTSWSTTLLNAAPLLLVAVGACVSARSGTFNIGQEGQVLIGAFAGAYVALRLAIVGPLLIVLVVAAAGAAGGVWAGLSALMLRVRGVNVVVSTLLMTFVAQQLVSYAVSSSWFLQETATGSGIANPQSNPMPSSARLASSGHYPNLQLNLGLLLAFVSSIVVSVLLARTRWGFRLKMLGLNPLTARHAGVRVAALGGLALAISGAFSGVAGAVLLTSPVGTQRLDANVSGNFGWDGLLVALVARSRPLIAAPVALLFGVLRAGGDFLAATGVPYYLVDVSKALLVLAVVAPSVIVAMLQRRRSSAKAAMIALPESITTRVEVPA